MFLWQPIEGLELIVVARFSSAAILPLSNMKWLFFANQVQIKLGLLQAALPSIYFMTEYPEGCISARVTILRERNLEKRNKAKLRQVFEPATSRSAGQQLC